MNILYRRAISQEDQDSARLIVESQYQDSGYLDKEASLKEKIERYQGSMTTFLACYNDIPLATLSLITDSASGLPLEELYHEEVDVLRTTPATLAEATQLASHKQNIQTFLPHLSSQQQSSIILPLFRLVLQYAIHKGIDSLCIVVHPKHAPLYDAIGFHNIGELRHYASLNHAPALAKTLDLDAFQHATKKSFLLSMLQTPIDTAILDGHASLEVPLAGKSSPKVEQPLPAIAYTR